MSSPVVPTADDSENIPSVSANVVAVEATPLQAAPIVDPSSPSQASAAQLRAEFVSTRIYRRGEAKFGLSMKKTASGDVVISRLLEDGILWNTPLHVGDHLLSIDGCCCRGMDPHTIAALLRSIDGPVSLVARNLRGKSNLVEAQVEKPHDTAPVGITMRLNGRRSLEISDIRASGLFVDSVLVSVDSVIMAFSSQCDHCFFKVPMTHSIIPFSHANKNFSDRLISINSVGCQGVDPELARDLIRNAGRFVTIKAETSYLTGVVVASDV